MPDISRAKYSLPLSVCPESGNLARVSSFELDVEGASMCRYQAVKIIRLGRAKRREFVDLDPKGMYWLEYGNYVQPSMYGQWTTKRSCLEALFREEHGGKRWDRITLHLLDV